MVKDKQVAKLMDEIAEGQSIEVAALRSGMHRNTAARYVKSGKLPSESLGQRDWRTRVDPFEEAWPELERRLEAAPELEAKALFEHLQRCHPGRYHDGQVRTLQRRVQRWRVEHGPDREVMLPQSHRPGEAMQTDFTFGNELGVTIGGAGFDHLLCHVVLPYSNWESVTVARSESMLALRRGLQEALYRLGKVPGWSQTDNSTAATHDLATGKRGFNQEYLGLCEYLGMRPRTIGIGESHQNGDVEALNGALKRRVTQHLLLRGSSDFESAEAYERWLWSVIERANLARARQLAEELAVMRPLLVARSPESRELAVRVSRNGTIAVQRNTYSVPPRLSGAVVKVRITELWVEVLYAGEVKVRVERLCGKGRHLINYRHVIWSLVKKPGAFARYRWRDSLYPLQCFRRAHEALTLAVPERIATLEYLRILHLAAATLEYEVATALELLLEAGRVPRLDAVRELIAEHIEVVPAMAALVADVASYDELISAGVGS